MATTDDKLERLKEIMRDLGSVVVAYSGGVDSAFLLEIARETLSDKALGAIADSPSLSREELRAALDLAAGMTAPVVALQTNELEREEYRANGADRCYHCKVELFEHLVPLAQERGFEHIVYGANMDDLRDVRPGAKAAREFSVRAPLQEAGLYKEEIRELSRAMGLPTWDKPAFACLSSRIPFGTTVTVEALAKVEAAENVLREFGFRQFRVRHHDKLARIEVDQQELGRMLDAELRETVVARIKQAGYSYVALDLDGYRSGSMHEAGRRIPLRLIPS